MISFQPDGLSTTGKSQRWKVFFGHIPVGVVFADWKTGQYVFQSFPRCYLSALSLKAVVKFLEAQTRVLRGKLAAKERLDPGS